MSETTAVSSGIRPLCGRNREPGAVRMAICMSGAGSNAEELLRYAGRAEAGFRAAVIFTDDPESSRAAELAEQYGVPLEQLDIRKFYAERGEETIRLDTDRRRQLRDEWSDAVWRLLEPYRCTFAVFAGFVPLTNLAGRIPCLNVHPGDLTLEDGDGRRIYAGLHCRPVERAILDGRRTLRSSVILVQTYSGSGRRELDGGPVLGVSAPVSVDLGGSALDELRAIEARREKPPCRDELRRVALRNIERLKIAGDHVVLPQVVSLFAKGAYGIGDDGALFFRPDDGEWIRVSTVEFSADAPPKARKFADGAGRSSRSRAVRYCRYLYARIVRDSGSPDYVARGWALGMFVGCVIPVFCQLIIAVPLSFVFRGSKIGAALGTFITTPPTAIFIYPVQIWVGNKLIHGNLSPEAAKKMLDVFNSGALSLSEKWSAFADMGGSLVAAFFAGGLLWAAVMTPLTYFGVRCLVVRYRKMREKLFGKFRKGRERS